MSRVEIRVDELVLRGVPADRAHRVRADLEARLSELARGTDVGALGPRQINLVRPSSLSSVGDEPVGWAAADRIWAAVTGDPEAGDAR